MMENVTHEDEDNQLSNDVLFDVLSHERRRFALYCLKRYQTPISLVDLADEVARLEYDAETPLQVSGEDVKEIYLHLYHSHIPRMEEANLLKYSQENDTVYLKSDISDLKPGKFI
ncbi:hypothetical protein CP556_20680 [Natrinema sp. CBA1119]|uniref:DUF7344 domain-containing protein n=1 Tax=Natrinema sp. CBA1119 TaxID=1608465 RepID=UPI000BF62194|nr:hypothetical protein [Natrinema sp. CBA1119]PGF14644.1 hypothetical protein CP556_20680 [Natrinema sp. CBA1119]